MPRVIESQTTLYILQFAYTENITLNNSCLAWLCAPVNHGEGFESCVNTDEVDQVDHDELELTVQGDQEQGN